MKTPAPKRVLMLIENIPFQLDPRVRQEATALLRAGYSVSVICPSLDSKWGWQQDSDGVALYSFPTPPSGSGFLSYVWEYTYSFFVTFLISLRIWWKNGLDIIHAANPPDTSVFIALFYKLFGIQFVFDHHDLAPELFAARFDRGNRSPIHAVLVGLEKLSCRVASHVITTNQSYKELEIQRARVPEERITVVRNGPNLHVVGKVEPAPDFSMERKTLIGYAGSIGFQDGVDYLLRALSCRIDLGRTDFSCFLVGDGAAVPMLKVLADELQLSNYLTFVGWVDSTQVPGYLRRADICVSPEPSNPYNDRSSLIKVTEYMALGKPIVAFELPETRLTAREAAIYASPNRESDFAQKILILMDDPIRRKEMGRIGRERVEKELAWSFQEERLLGAYSKLADA